MIKKKCRLTLLAVILTTSCSSTSATNGAESNAERVAVSSDPSLYNGTRIKLPLDDYFFDQDQLAGLEAAVDKLSGACMSRLHQKWPSKVAKPSNIPWNSRRYGVTSLKSAKEYGYKAPLPLGVSAEQAAEMDKHTDSRLTHVTRRTISIYTGENRAKIKGVNVPVGGCRGEAYRKLGLTGPDIPFQDRVAALQKKTWDDALKSAATAHAENKWRNCMTTKGYSYKTPVDALEDPRWITSGKTTPKTSRRSMASSQEIRTAVDDVKCKQKSLYVETWHSVEVALQKSAIHQNQEPLDKTARQVRVTLTKVQGEIN